MRQVREIVRLHEAGLSTRQIGIRVGVAASTVRLTLRRVAAAGLARGLPAEQTEAALEAALFSEAGKKIGHRRHAEPDWAAIHQELKRKHVTLTIVWDEYIARYPDGYRYSRFCELYRGWESRLSVTMRQSHRAGERLFVDYAGDTVPVIVDRLTGQTRAAQIFVAVLGASNFLYAEATWTQALPDWIEAHNRALGAIGGVPALLVPDNTRVAVIKACLYDPVVNRTYADMATHYGSAVLPARPYKPRDKAKVEVGVLIAERWLLGRLRHTKFYGLAELNAAIAEFCRRLNDERVIRRVGQTRRQLLETVERRALKPLPAEPYALAEWRIRRVGIDYHVEVENHFYSVPHRYARAEVDARLTARTVEVFCRGERIAAHRRGSGDGKHTTVAEHMPSSHRRYADWTVARIRREADGIGPSVSLLCGLILERRPHPEQGFRACLGILKLVRSVGATRLEAAAARAIEIGALTYGSVKSILDNKLDRQAAGPVAAEHNPIRHRNIRGGGYFH
jgi:transposase